MANLYLIASLRNPKVQQVADALRTAGHDVFDDWHCAGPEADDFWRDYEKARGHNYKEALAGKAAKNVFKFDKSNLDASDIAILVAPAGKSAHLELGYMAGKGKPTFVLFEDEPERWDVMYQFCTGVCLSLEELTAAVAAASHPLSNTVYRKQMQQFQGVPDFQVHSTGE